MAERHFVHGPRSGWRGRCIVEVGDETHYTHYVNWPSRLGGWKQTFMTGDQGMRMNLDSQHWVEIPYDDDLTLPEGI